MAGTHRTMQVHDHMIILRENTLDVIAMLGVGRFDPVEEITDPVNAIGGLGTVLNVIIDQEFTQPPSTNR